MEKILIETPGYRSEICVGIPWGSVNEYLPETGVVIITDDNVRKIYGSAFPSFPVLSVSPGEESKRLSVVEALAEKLLESGMDRNGFILAIGGGVVSDLAGFLASVYLRGVRCGYISTSLLSQVDASTGGKNGVNLGGTKNMIGVIRQPEFVICDTDMLRTLEEEEYLSGLAEMIKTAVIGDPVMFDIIEKNRQRVLGRDTALLTDLVGMSVRFKAAVVTEDEKEKGLRRILNFGHTFGHAIEMKTGFRHGFAVASGMELAADFSFERKYISRDERDRMTAMLNDYGLLKEYSVSTAEIEQLVSHDKKKAGGSIHFVFSEGIGKATPEKVPIEEILDFYRRTRDKQ